MIEEITRRPDTSQADLANRLDTAVDSVNWYPKRLAKRVCVVATRLQHKRLCCLVTPRGRVEKGQLTGQYTWGSIHVYRRMRREARLLQDAEYHRPDRG